jgi:putative chitinase
MSAEAAFDALRAHKREVTGEGLSEADVAVVNALFASWNVDSHNPTALSDGAKFFAAVRKAFGALSEGQVEGFERLLQAYGVAQWPIAFAAYGLATGWRETNKTMQPVREAYWLTEDWRKKNLTYWPWYGRGDVQLTWARNYARADDELKLGGVLRADPDKALDPAISARIMVKGMTEGWFSGKKLADYLPATGPADIHQFANARQIINGLDDAIEIANNALTFQAALMAGGWR